MKREILLTANPNPCPPLPPDRTLPVTSGYVCWGRVGLGEEVNVSQRASWPFWKLCSMLWKRAASDCLICSRCCCRVCSSAFFPFEKTHRIEMLAAFRSSGSCILMQRDWPCGQFARVWELFKLHACIHETFVLFSGAIILLFWSVPRS